MDDKKSEEVQEVILRWLMREGFRYERLVTTKAEVEAEVEEILAKEER